MKNKKLLEKIRHEFTTLHGLHASDGFRVYNEAQREGLGCNAAWDRFVEETFQIDVENLINRIDRALKESD